MAARAVQPALVLLCSAVPRLAVFACALSCVSSAHYSIPPLALGMYCLVMSEAAVDTLWAVDAGYFRVVDTYHFLCKGDGAFEHCLGVRVARGASRAAISGDIRFCATEATCLWHCRMAAAGAIGHGMGISETPQLGPTAKAFYSFGCSSYSLVPV